MVTDLTSKDTGFSVYISFLSRCCNRMSDGSNLRKGGLFWPTVIGGQSIMIGRHGIGAGRCCSHVSTVREQRVMNASTQLTFSLSFSAGPLPSSRVTVSPQLTKS